MTGRGRPPTGVKVQVRIPADDLATIDARAALDGRSRADLVREIVGWWAEEVRGPNGRRGRGCPTLVFFDDP